MMVTDDYDGSKIGVLFVPFDAKGRFAATMSQSGVKMFPSTHKDSDPTKDGFVPAFNKRLKEENKPQMLQDGGTTWSKQEIIDNTPTIIKCLIEEILESECGNAHYIPKLLFLSEEVIKKGFPDRIALAPVITQHRSYKNLEYIRMGDLGDNIRQEQQICAYNLKKGSRNNWDMEDFPITIRERISDNAKQNLLAVVLIPPNGEERITVAGVHLSSKYTNKSGLRLRQALTQIRTICLENEVDLMIGDLNFDAEDIAGEVGSVGCVPCHDIISAGNAAHDTEVVFTGLKTFSNSKDNKHFMGTIRLSDKVQIGGTGCATGQGRLLSRYLETDHGARYFSDHAPFFACLKGKTVPTAYPNSDPSTSFVHQPHTNKRTKMIGTFSYYLD